MALKRTPIDRRDLPGSVVTPLPTAWFPGGVWGGGGLSKGVPLGRDTQDIDREYSIADVQEMRRILNRPAVGAVVSGGGPGVTTRPIVPQMVVPPITPPTIHKPIVWGGKLFNKGGIPVARTIVPPPQVMPRPSVTTGGRKTGESRMPSVTDFLRGILPGSNDIFDQGANLLNIWQQGGSGTPAVPPPVVLSSPPTGIGGAGIPNLPTTFGSCEPDDPMKGYVMKKVCGQWRWIKPKRRRRKPLLTESDYNALLRIESLKVNKNMTVAIAKTLSR